MLYATFVIVVHTKSPTLLPQGAMTAGMIVSDTSIRQWHPKHEDELSKQHNYSKVPDRSYKLGKNS